MLVSSLAAFDRYQREDAWTWEHQALLRSRAVAGSANVCEAYEEIRRQALMQYVKRDTLREEVINMRTRMREELSRGTEEQFDLKQDRGGIADIEFMVQYLVLKNAADCPDLLEFSDSIRQLEALARNGLLEKSEEELLADTYRAYRALVHRHSLAGEPGLAMRGEVAAQAGRIVSLWEQVFA
jgi:glutamate-ammonia-ligase adenylyltransferase